MAQFVIHYCYIIVKSSEPQKVKIQGLCDAPSRQPAHSCVLSGDQRGATPQVL